MKNELRKMGMDELKLKYSYLWTREFISLSQENRVDLEVFIYLFIF